MSKHQTCVECGCGFVGPDSGIGSNLCDTCSVELHGECQRQLVEAAAEIDRLREALSFVQEKCKSRNAGNMESPFAYLWKKDWDRFIEMAAEAAGGNDDE